MNSWTIGFFTLMRKSNANLLVHPLFIRKKEDEKLFEYHVEDEVTQLYIV